MNRLGANLQVLLHVAVWGAILMSPLIFVGNEDRDDIGGYIINGVIPLTLLIVLFYANYFYLVPKHYLGGKKRIYWIANIVMIAVFTIATHAWLEFNCKEHQPEPEGWTAPPRDAEPPDIDRMQRYVQPEIGPAPPQRESEKGPRPIPKDTDKLFFMLRDIFNLCFSAGAATFIVVSMRWKEADEARKKAEAAKTEAELKNLRNQINPHFLLNTLNNIYALTAFDTAKAQTAIHELSSLLRHILYDNQNSYVRLNDEVAFMRSYIDLMKIRLNNNVEVTVNIDVSERNDIMIAPLIFISLIENAFKHGVSPTKHSFIRVTIAADGGRVMCLIENSNFPKDTNDHSGHGIGLRQVKQRLEISYKGRYEWTKGLSTDGNVYTSKITLYDTEVHDN